MKKLIFLDIDGTLTPPGSNVPPDSAQEAIRLARRRGHGVCLCTGRNYGLLSPLLAYGFDGVIGSTGGYVKWGEQVLYDCPMTRSQQERSMEVFRRSGIYRTVESRDHAYTDEAFKTFLRESAGSNSELLRWREQVENSLHIRPMAEYRGEPIYKIVFMSPGRERLTEPMAELEEEFAFCFQGTDELGVVNGELINRQYNKGTALRRLSEHLGVPLEDTVAFGDSMNDLEMLETAGLGICMGGGSPALQSAADEVCPPLEEDGLYRAFAAHDLL